MRPCPQCSSLWCGPIVCRFSGITNEDAAAQDKTNAYANTAIKREQESPRYDFGASACGRSDGEGR